jgi:hypothetical protein
LEYIAKCKYASRDQSAFNFDTNKYKQEKGTDIYQVETFKDEDDEDLKVPCPSCEKRVIKHDPIVPPWNTGNVSKEVKITMDAYWLSNPKFIYKRIWKVETELEGLGRGVDDLYQEQMAQAAILNGVCYGNGAGGSGKSNMIEFIVATLTTNKHFVYGCSFTHIAVANISQCFPKGAHTIQHLLLNKIQQIKRAIAKGHKVSLILDESSMIPMHFWAHLANLKFVAVEFYIFGNYAGQFKPIMLDDAK